MCTRKTLEFNLVIYAVLLQNVTDMIQLERPDWQQVMAYVTAIYKHFETWKAEGPLAAHLVSIWCCVQILFITSYFSSYSCKQEQRLEIFQIWVGEFLLPFFPTACIQRLSEEYALSNKNPSAWNFLSPEPEVTCSTVAIIIWVVLLSPYLRVRAVSLSSIHYNQSHRVYIAVFG